jgi:hypothetical protein
MEKAEINVIQQEDVLSVGLNQALNIISTLKPVTLEICLSGMLLLALIFS